LDNLIPPAISGIKQGHVNRWHEHISNPSVGHLDNAKS
jgi:hypothetical protein